MRVLVGAVAGLVIGYFGGAYLSCSVWYPKSNTCGFIAVFITAPASAVAGAFLMNRIGRNKVTD
jgi:hypothetical protein